VKQSVGGWVNKARRGVVGENLVNSYSEQKMIGEIVLSLVLEKLGDSGFNAVRKRYDPLARRAGAKTGDQLKEKYRGRFVDIFGSRNFIEELSTLDSRSFAKEYERLVMGNGKLMRSQSLRLWSSKFKKTGATREPC
jgi:hypothetical protein